MMKRKLLLALLLAIGATTAISFVRGEPAKAVTAADWRAGRIIDDTVFTNKNAMSVGEIQDFLNYKVGRGGYDSVPGVCDTNGVRNAAPFNSSISRAAYARSIGKPDKWTCLSNYYEVPKTVPGPGIPANNYGGAPIPAGAKSAAQLIWDAAQAYNISPKVLLVTIHKESAGPLTTDDWPWLSQYTYAMGARCPDSGPGGSANCDPNYAGFSMQIRESAALMRWYLDNMHQSWWSYKKPGNNSILYHPNANCGSSNVFIETKATAALYTYTPYQPNQAALNNMYGTGDGCSAYGNRNFWRIYNDWFGPTNDNVNISYDLRLISPITLSPAAPIAGETVTVSYTVKNFASGPIIYNNSVLQCRFNNVANCDPAWAGGSTINAGAERTFTHSIVFQGGSYNIVPYYLQNNGLWYRFGSNSTQQNTAQLTVPDIRLVSPITTSPVAPVAGQAVNVSLTLKNFGTQMVVFQTSLIQCRLNGGGNCDSPYGGAIGILPGEQHTFSYSLPALAGGSNALVPYFMQNGIWYKYGALSGISTSVTLDTPDIRLTTPISATPADAVPGQTVAVSFTVQNFGSSARTFQTSLLQCRRNGANCDSAEDAPITINAGAQRTFTYNVTAQAGGYTFTPYFHLNNNWHTYSRGTAPATSLGLTVPPYVADMRLLTPITISPSNPLPGQEVTASFRAKNFGSKPAIFQSSVLQCRRNSMFTCDPAWDSPLTINAGAERDFTYTFTPQAGSYILTPFYLQNSNWHRYNAGTVGSSALSFTVDAYVADMRLVSPITITPSNPTAGQAFSVTYTVQNFGSQPAIYQASVLQCRRNNFINCDPAWDAPVTIAAGDQEEFTINFPAATSGNHVFTPFYAQNDQWYRYNQGATGANSLTVTIP